MWTSFFLIYKLVLNPCGNYIKNNYIVNTVKYLKILNENYQH